MASKKKTKSETATVSVLPPSCSNCSCASGTPLIFGGVSLEKNPKSNLLGAKVDSSFLAEVDAVAARCGLTRSNFVRKVVAEAVRAYGGAVDDASVVSYQGQQTAPKEVVEKRIAAARAAKATYRKDGRQF